ncbi:MAG: hypothetical protein WDZ29_06365 [Balneolaceae bacterium]
MFMERIVKQVTNRLVGNLPSEKGFFHPDELERYDIPDFVTQRVVVELSRNLDETITPPYTEWAEMKADRVQAAWDEFVEAVLDETRLPYPYAATLFETVISDLLEILVQPRKAIPEAIFGPEDALQREKLEQRTSAVTVYRQLALAPARYMERKNLKALTLEQCRIVIEQVDSQLSDRYTASDWSRFFEPLFQLVGETVDTNLIRLFYEDRGMEKEADYFRRLNRSLTHSELVKIISDGIASENVQREGVQNESRNHTRESNSEQTETGLSGSRVEPAQDSGLASEEDGGVPLHRRFMFDESEAEEEREETPEERSVTINEELFISETDIPKEEPETPSIWRNFADPEEESDDSEPSVEKRSDKKQQSASGLDTEPPVRPEHTNEGEKMARFIGTQKERFVEELFEGSEEAFMSAMDRLSGLEEWEDATRIIEREIFYRHRIELFDDVAVDFTDQLHLWFTEYKSS